MAAAFGVLAAHEWLLSGIATDPHFFSVATNVNLDQGGHLIDHLSGAQALRVATRASANSSG